MFEAHHITNIRRYCLLFLVVCWSILLAPLTHAIDYSDYDADNELDGFGIESSGKIVFAYGTGQFSGNDSDLFDSNVGVYTLGYLYPMAKLSDDEDSITLLEVSISSYSAISAKQDNKICDIGFEQACSLEFELQLMSFNVGASFYTELGESVLPFAKFGLGYYQISFAEKAIGEVESTDVSPSVASMSFSVGVGVIVSYIFRLELLLHGPIFGLGGDFASAQTASSKYSGKYAVNELRFSYLF